MRRLVAALFCLCWSAAAEASAPCSAEEPCRIAGGEYHLAIPSGWDRTTPLPVLLFFHGHRSSGLSVIRDRSLQAGFVDHGYLLVAPNGDLRPEDGARAWPARTSAAGWRDDVAFTLAVLDDVAVRFPIDPERIYAAGFSAGGSMAYMLACHAGQRFAGFVSISGALRRPVPEGTCPAGPVRMLHFHGFADTQVPLEGRGIGDWHQGDVFESLDLLRRTDGCTSQPAEIAVGDAYWCRSWTGCASGRDIRFCLHAGGHGMPAGWAGIARNWMEG
jgi:polyhydroxybutyrate depolymerase